MSNTYAARKARGLCVFHAKRPARPGSVMCEACAARQKAYRFARLTPAERHAIDLRQRRREHGLHLVPAAPTKEVGTAVLVCCGTWWQVTHIPLLVPCCGRLWLQTTAHVP